MVMPRHAAQRDLNEPAVLKPFKLAGWKILRLQIIDALILRPDGHTLLIEVKNKSGKNKLTTNQDRLIRDGWPIVILETPEQAQALVDGYFEMRRA